MEYLDHRGYARLLAAMKIGWIEERAGLSPRERNAIERAYLCTTRAASAHTTRIARAALDRLRVAALEAL